jgi:hypothetical protein
VAYAPKSEEQKQRLAAALRENLKRRKARDRALAKSGSADAQDGPGSDPKKAGKPD